MLKFLRIRYEFISNYRVSNDIVLVKYCKFNVVVEVNIIKIHSCGSITVALWSFDYSGVGKFTVKIKVGVFISS